MSFTPLQAVLDALNSILSALQGLLSTSIDALGDDVSSNSNSQLNVTPFHVDGTEGALISGVDYVSGKNGVDASTNVLMGINYTHHEIHSGSHYYIQGYLELDNTDTFYVKLVTPDTTKWTHFLFNIKSTGICSSTFDEAATGGMTGGASVTPINNNRNSANTSGIVITSGVTANTGYTTRLENDEWGANGFKENIGGGSARDDEIILKQNTVYCRGFISGADDNIIQFKASWYEHIDKD